MSIVDILILCFRNLLKRKLRTFLAVGMVTIGTMAIILAVAMGLADDARFEELVGQMGDVTLISVTNPNAWGGRMVMIGGGEMPQPEMDLDDDTLAIIQNMPGVVIAAPRVNVDLHFRSGNYVLQWARVIGMTPEAMVALGYTAQEGRLLEDGDTLQVVFGALAETNFQNPNTRNWVWRFGEAMSGMDVEPLVNIFSDRINMSPDQRFLWGGDEGGAGDEIDIDDIDAPRPIRPHLIEVVGMLEGTGSWEDGNIYMHLDMVQRLQVEAERAQQDTEREWGFVSARNRSETQGYAEAVVRVADLESVAPVRDAIQEMGFWANSATEQVEGLQAMDANRQLLIIVSGAIALFVAAIGIIAIMFMSVYERTREIGVMKVIGAAIKDIRRLFLLEAGAIGFIGGVFGVGLSYLLAFILNLTEAIDVGGGQMDMWLSWHGIENTTIFLITPGLAGIALVFSTIIGLLSGYFPARRAMRLSALSAIRTE